jgi:ABC-type branched-subunit amino acid transport system ATPase component
VPIIEVEHLHKRYRDAVADEDVSLTVEAGEIFGIVGPNGAGKTTTVELIQGCAPPTAAASACSGSTPGGTGTSCASGSGPSCSRATCTTRSGWARPWSCSPASTATRPSPAGCWSS